MVMLPGGAGIGRAAAARGVTTRKPRLGVVKLASCDGCQLTLLDLEDQLLDLLSAFDLVEFAEASSHRSAGPYDIVLVEGSVSTPEQLEEIVRIRRATPLLVTIGACATAGGIQALRNWRDHDAMRAAVYPWPQYVESLATATPVAEHVTVDAAAPCA
jgi:sulfhydrogenase subunit delta